MSTLTFVNDLDAMVDGVRALFVDWAITAVVEDGFRDHARQDNQGPGGGNRVVFMHAAPDGKAGKLMAPTQVGYRRFRPSANAPDEITARSLATWEHKIFVSVWGHDSAATEDERKQLGATIALFENVVRAVHVAHAGAFACANWEDEVYHVPPHQRAYGRELQTLLTLESPLMDIPRELTRPSPAVARENA
jgi:hypothetical protein